MFLLGMVLRLRSHILFFATKDLGMTTNQYGLLLASAAISQFTVNSIIIDFRIRITLMKKYYILALLMGALGFQYTFL